MFDRGEGLRGGGSRGGGGNEDKGTSGGATKVNFAGEVGVQDELEEGVRGWVEEEGEAEVRVRDEVWVGCMIKT